MKKILYLSFAGLLLLSACAAEGPLTEEEIREVAPVEMKVYKYDGSLRCEGGGVPLDEMQAELTEAGVTVLCAQTGHDGLARPQVCEAQTGNINIFTISGADLEQARELGFSRVEKLSEYSDEPCQR